MADQPCICLESEELYPSHNPPDLGGQRDSLEMNASSWKKMNRPVDTQFYVVDSILPGDNCMIGILASSSTKKSLAEDNSKDSLKYIARPMIKISLRGQSMRQRFLFLVFIVLSPPSEAAEAGRMSDYNTIETFFHFIKRFGSSRRRRLDGLKEMDGRSCGVVAMLFKKCVIPNDVKYCRSFFEDLSKNCIINYEDLVRKADIGEEGKLDHLNHSIMTNNKAPCEALTKLYQECTSKLGRDHVACRYYNKDLGRYCHDGKPVAPPEAVWKRIFGGTLTQYWGGGKVDLKTSA